MKPAVRFAVFCLASAIAARAGSGQNPQPAMGVTVRGQAFDSLHNAPLEGATVMMMGSGRTTTSDDRGRFEFSGVAPGTHKFVVYHAVLDSVGLGALSTVVEVTDGRGDVRLAVPSFLTLYRAACGAERTPGDSGFVYGTVKDVLTSKSVSGALVNLTWTDLEVDSVRRVHQQRRRIQVHSDASGSYGICGVPKSAAPRIQARAETRSSGLIDLPTADAGIRRRDLFVADEAQTSERGTIAGTVTKPGGLPLSGARIVLDDVPEVRSGADGRFTVSGVPAGTRQLQVLAVGITPIAMTVDVLPNDTTLVNVEGKTLTTLDVVRVIGTATQRRLLRDFDDRRRTGFGYMRDSTAIGQVGTISAALSGFPSTEVKRVGNYGGIVILFPQGAGKCVAALWVDGRREMSIRDEPTASFEILNDLHPDEIAAIEVYPRGMTAPHEFYSPGSDCGVVAVWTKWAFSR